jgi:cytochrome c-type biogenesis protein CcmF
LPAWHGFLQDDFSVRVVASNSNSLLPPIYKFSAVWGNHEGSLLLWVLIPVLLAGGGGRLQPRPAHGGAGARARGHGADRVGFLCFPCSPPTPSSVCCPHPADGNDLNPLLQDPGLAIHPPLLYMGYVGFSVAFAFAIAALIGGRSMPPGRAGRGPGPTWPGRS